MWQDIQCRVGRHKWGPIQGDNWGAFHQCEYCAKIKRVGRDHQAEIHEGKGPSH